MRHAKTIGKMAALLVRPVRIVAGRVTQKQKESISASLRNIISIYTHHQNEEGQHSPRGTHTQQGR
jgi:hypothetical protein